MALYAGDGVGAINSVVPAAHRLAEIVDSASAALLARRAVQ
jgi:hypothetical protein